MHKLSLSTFISASRDFETNQYRILHALKSYQDEFSHNRIYPTLSELISLVTALQNLLQEKQNIERALPQQLKDIDLEKKQLVFEPMERLPRDIDHIIELIVWALPRLTKVIDEGKEIHEFVDSNIIVEQVGIVPMYRDEGYCFVPENSASLLHVLRYEVSLFTSGSEKYRGLKTRLVKTVRPEPPRSSPESIKLELIEEHHDLPAPATFMCATDLDFPFEETILPVAKRKLIAKVLAA